MVDDNQIFSKQTGNFLDNLKLFNYYSQWNAIGK